MLAAHAKARAEVVPGRAANAVKLATTREEITKALAHAGLGPRPPPHARPTMLGQLELELSRRLNGHTNATEHTAGRGSRRSAACVARVVPGFAPCARFCAPSVHDRDPSWVLRHSGGGIFGVDERGLSVGSGPDDDLRIADCPPRSALVSVAHGQLLLEAQVSLSVSGRKGELVRLPAGSAHRLSRGDVVHLGRAQISVIVGGVTHMGTTVGRGDGPAHDCAKLTSVRLQSLPRGGRLFVAFGGEPAVAYLAGRRCDLAACLLQPPGPYEAGELIPDEVVIERVWPDGTTARSAVGVLLHRLRRDLVHAGLDGAALVVRAEGGGATRFAVPPGASVVVE